MTIEPTTQIYDPEPDPVALAVVEFDQQITKAVSYAQAITVASLEDERIATENLAVLARIKKMVEDRRTSIVKPMNDRVKEVNERFKKISTPLEEADKITRSKILAYREVERKKREEIEAIEREKMELARREAAAKGGEFTIDLTPIEKPPEQPKTIHTDIGSAGTQKTWRFEVEDFEKLPNEYKTADLVKIGKVIRAGVVIPGVKAWQEESLRVSTR